MREDGGERLYSIRVRNRVVNIGAAVISSSAGRRDRSLLPRREGRERRPGLRRHADEHQRPDGRLPAPHRSRGRRVRAARDVLRLRGLRPRRVHGRAARGHLPAPVVGERHEPAARPPPDDAGERRPADDRDPDARPRRRRRSVLAGPELRTCARRRCGVRPVLRHRALPAPGRGAADASRTAARDVPGRRLPGGEERGRVRA